MNKIFKIIILHQYPFIIGVLVFLNSCGYNLILNKKEKTTLTVSVVGIDTTANLLILNDDYDTIHKTEIINNTSKKITFYENKMYSDGYPYIVRIYNNNKNYSHIIYIEKYKNNTVLFQLQNNNLLHTFNGNVVYTNASDLQNEINKHFIKIANFQSDYQNGTKSRDEYDKYMKEFMLKNSIPFIYKYPDNDYSKLLLYIIINNGDKDLLETLNIFFLEPGHQKKYFYKKTNLYKFYISKNKLNKTKENIDSNDNSIKKAYIDAINQKKESFDLNKLNGKIIIVDIWATWCKPCLKKIPEYIELTNDPNYKDKIELVFLSIDSQFEIWNKYVDENFDKKFIHIIDYSGNTRNFYNIKQIPANLIINKDGELIGQNILQINSLKSVIDSWSK